MDDKEKQPAIWECDTHELQQIPCNMIAFEKAEFTTEPIDRDLVIQAIEGDQKAFSTLFMQTYRYVYLTVKHYLSDDEDIYDAIQETYIKVYTKLHLLKKPEAFYSWLNQVSRNCAKDIVGRKNFSTVDFSEEQEYEELRLINEEFFESDIAIDITAVLKEMPEEQAKLLVMVYYDGMKIADIARLLHQPPSSVYSRFHAARKRLKALLKARGIDKPLYGGGFITMIATSLRDAIGTELLSAAIAEEILGSVLEAKSKEKVVISKITRQQRNRAVLRIASLIVAISLLTSGAVVGVGFGVLNWGESSADTLLQGDQSLISSRVESQSDFVESTVSQPQSDTASLGNMTSTQQQSNTVSLTSASEKTSSSTASKLFTPDYSPGQANKLGNFPNNLGRNKGSVAKQGDWIYYAIGNGYRYLMKMKTDGSNRQMLAEHESGFTYINVVGDWIYYCGNGIRRMRTDGSLMELVSTVNAENLHVIEETGYFINIEGTRLYTLDIKNKKTTLLKEVGGGCIVAVRDDILLYLDRNNLYRMNRTTGESQELYRNAIRCLVNGDIVYIETNGDVIESLNYMKPSAWGETVKKGINGLLFFSPYQGGVIGCYHHSEDGSLGEPVSTDTPRLISVSGEELDCSLTPEALLYGYGNSYNFGEDKIYSLAWGMHELYYVLPNGDDLVTIS